jgi:peptidoglycan/LPS O-acetylase OafA/YrhL
VEARMWEYLSIKKDSWAEVSRKMTLNGVSRHPRIIDRADGRDNNFNLIRMLAATGVLVSHSYPISLGPNTPEPLSDILAGTTLGMICVMVFFSISGFFISRSFEKRRSLKDFLQARALRLFPALTIVLAVTVAVSAVFLTSALPKVFWLGASEYFIRNLLLFFPKYPLPGVFEANPFGPAINGSLWTLNYEVICYLGVVLLGILGLLGRPAAFAVCLTLFLVLYALAQVQPLHSRFENLAQLGLPFSIGMSFWVWRKVIPLSWPLAGAALVVAALLGPTPIFNFALVLALTYGIFVLGYTRLRPIEGYNRLGDFSYGTYIYSFPLQQLVASFGVVSPLENMALAFPAVLICAILSWNFVEKPAIRFRGVPTVRHTNTFR